MESPSTDCEVATPDNVLEQVVPAEREGSADATLGGHKKAGLGRVPLHARGQSMEAGDSRLTSERWNEIQGRFSQKESMIKESISSKRATMFDEIKHLRHQSTGGVLLGQTEERSMDSPGRSVNPYDEITEMRRGLSVKEITGMFKGSSRMMTLDDWRVIQMEQEAQYRRATQDARGRLFQIHFQGNESSRAVNKLKYYSNRQEKCQFIKDWAIDQKKQGLPVTDERAEAFLLEIGVISRVAALSGVNRPQSARLPNTTTAEPSPPSSRFAATPDGSRPPAGWKASIEYEDWKAVVREMVPQFAEGGKYEEVGSEVEPSPWSGKDVVPNTGGPAFDWDGPQGDEMVSSQELLAGTTMDEIRLQAIPETEQQQQQQQVVTPHQLEQGEQTLGEGVSVVKPFVDLEHPATEVMSDSEESSPASRTVLPAGQAAGGPRGCIPLPILEKVKQLGVWVSSPYQAAVVKRNQSE